VSEVVVARSPEPRLAAGVAALADLVSARERRTALREQQRDALERGGPGWAGIVRWSPTGDRVLGYAGVLREGRGWALEVVVDSDSAAAVALVHAALDVIAAAGGGAVQLWRSSPSDRSDREALDAGLRPARDVLEIRRPLPVGEPWTLDVRPFVPGRDEDAWIDVNNRAFAWHPEQGGWSIDDIRAREAEPWFDPDGFLLHERDGHLAGFCWTKVHVDHDPPLGEIYVIAVDPEYGGKGLGRALVLAGLDHLATRGLTVGMLYVDGDNTTARALYDRLGFSLDHIDRAYAGTV